MESTEWGIQSSRTSLRKTLLGIDVAIVLSQDTAILEVGVKKLNYLQSVEEGGALL